MALSIAAASVGGRGECGLKCISRDRIQRHGSVRFCESRLRVLSVPAFGSRDLRMRVQREEMPRG